MILRISLLSLALISGLLLPAQSGGGITPTPNKGYSIAGGVSLSTRGAGLCFRAAFPAGRKQLAVLGEVTGLHSPYERKIQSLYNGRSYVLGKLNTAQIASLGLAFDRTLVPLRGGNMGTIAVGGFVAVDAVVYRPYYLEILRDPTPTTNYVIAVEPYNPNDPEHTYDGSIYGRARTPTDAVYKVIPGVGVGAYTFLDLTHESYQLSGVMLSLRADILSKPLQLMASHPQSSIFASATCSLLLGSKW